MFEDRLTERARAAIGFAAESALELGHNYVGTEHLLIGLIREGEGVAGKILEANEVSEDKVIEKISAMVGTGEPIPSGQPEATPRTKRVFERSYIEAQRMGHNYVGTEHLLIALLRERECLAVRILVSLGVQPKDLYQDVMQLLNDTGEEEETPQATGTRGKGKGGNLATLMKFGRDLTQMAKEGKLDPIIGRDDAIERVVQILSRLTKNNPCLIGDPVVVFANLDKGLNVGHVVCNLNENCRNCCHGNHFCIRHEENHDKQKKYCMNHAGNRCAAAVFDVCRSSRNGTRCGNTAEESRTYVAYALCDKFSV